VQSYTRRKLKQDVFVESTAEAMNWAGEHRNTVISALVALFVVAAIIFGWMQYTSYKDDKASIEFANAMRTYDAPIRAASEAPIPNVATFPTAKDRATAANKQFQKITADFPHTDHGQLAHYMTGVTQNEMGDTAKAQQTLKDTADHAGKQVAALAKFALASIYASSGKQDDAARLYREVVDANVTSVPKVTAQLELAGMLEKKDPGEAAKIYGDIQKDNTGNDLAELAQQKLNALKAQTGTAAPPQQQPVPATPKK
jgi:predicted negative regulator of RcsB-dependent stress response